MGGVMTIAKTLRAALATAMMLTAAALASAPSLAQAWPTRSVRFIIPLGPGAGADIGARLIAERLQAKWSQPIVIENRPGGDGLIAITSLLQANDDHVLLFGPTGSFAVHPYQREHLPYDLERDLLPIARVSNTVVGVAVPAAMGLASLKEVVERARKEPGKLNSALVPGITELVYDGFVHEQKLDIVKVPYRDIVQAGTDVGEGRIQFIVASLAMLQPGIQGGRIKLVALNGKVTSETLAPGVPTVREAGFAALEFDGLVGLLGPKIMALELRQRVGADVVAAAKDPEFGRRLAATAQVVNPGDAVEFGRSMREQDAKIAAIATAIGLQRKKQQ